MPTLKLSELYTSTQGEGPLVGEPTQFVRFGGCNMRCPYWGEHTLPDGSVVGACDTPYAVYPEYWSEWEKVQPLQLADSLAEWPRHLCLTGGEPFLQPVGPLEAFVKEVLERDYTVEFFTNGTLFMPTWAFSYSRAITLDWKLSGSGESLGDSQTIHRDANLYRLTHKDAIKFTVASHDDLVEAKQVYGSIAGETRAEFYVGAVWGKITNEEVVDFVRKHELGWNLNVQVHKFVFGDIRGI